MKPTTYFIVMVFFFIGTLVPAYGIQSDSLLCDGRIVSVGNIAGDVIRKCGQPTYASQREDKIVEHDYWGDSVVITVLIDDWIFNFGPDRFQYRLLLVNGRVVKIESLDYGY